MLSRRTLRVGGRSGRTLSAALAEATAGDVVVAAAGTYSRQSGERFPLYVPPGVSVRGAGPGSSVVDGGGALETSWRPFRVDQSLVVLHDDTALQGFTVQNGGGCGVGVLPGARCTLEDNEVREHGLHGLLVSAPRDVVIRRNTFARNGTSGLAVPIYRPQPARPGECIFVVCAPGPQGADNRVLIERNTLDGSTSQESLTVIGDADRDGARAVVRIFDNVLTSARVAILLVASFGGSRHKLDVELAGNTVRGAGLALIGCGAYPVVRREAVGNELQLVARSNVVRDCAMGIQLLGAFGPARANVVTAELIDNALLGIQGAPLRVVGALGNREAAVIDNIVTCRALRNTTSGIGGARSVYVDGAGMEVPAGVLAKGNSALCALGDNTWQRSSDDTVPVVVRAGAVGNRAGVESIGDAPEAWEADSQIPMWWE